MAAGVLAIVIGALGAGALYSSSTDETSVVSVAHHVARGTKLTEEDLAIVQVPAGFDVETLPADELDTLVGRTALTDLPAGSFPLGAHVGEDPVPEGSALVGFRMHHGQMPVSDMPAGTVVQLIDLTEHPPVDESATVDPPQPGASQDAAPLHATVAVAPLPLDDGSFAVDVLVPVEASKHVAQLAAAGAVAVVVVKEP